MGAISCICSWDTLQISASNAEYHYATRMRLSEGTRIVSEPNYLAKVQMDDSTRPESKKLTKNRSADNHKHILNLNDNSFSHLW